MLRVVLVMFGLALLPGCAVRSSDAHGRITTFGFVWSTHDGPVPKHREPASTKIVFGPERLPDAPRWIELRAAGLIFENTPHTLGLTLGYKDSIWVFPVENAVTETESGAPASVRIVPLNTLQPPDP